MDDLDIKKYELQLCTTIVPYKDREIILLIQLSTLAS